MGFGLIDTIMAGRLSATDLAVVGIGTGVWAPVLMLFIGVLYVTTPMIAKAVGQNDAPQVGVLAKNALWLGLFLGIMALIVLQGFAQLLPHVGIPSELVGQTTRFLQISSLGLPAVTMYTALRCYSEALGHARPMTLITAGALPILAFFNYVFMYGNFGVPKLGALGAAIATISVQWLMLLALFLYTKTARRYQNHPIKGSYNQKTLGLILKIGAPVGLALFFEVSLFTMASVVISPLGAVMVGAHQIALSITSVLFMLPLSLSVAMSARVGYHLGRQDAPAFLRVQKVGMMMAAVFALMSMSVLWAFREPIVRLYTSDDRLVQIATSLMIFPILYQLFDAWQVCAAGCLRALQDTKIPMLMTLLAYWGVAFSLGYYLTRHSAVGVGGMWIGFIVGLLVSCALLVPRLIWQNKKVLARF